MFPLITKEGINRYPLNGQNLTVSRKSHNPKAGYDRRLTDYTPSFQFGK